jgi:hypothetical protein
VAWPTGRRGRKGVGVWVSWRGHAVHGVAKAAGDGRRLVRQREASGAALLCVVDVPSASWRWRRGGSDPAAQREESHSGDGAAGHAAGQVTPHYWWQRQSSSDTPGSAREPPAADAKVVTSWSTRRVVVSCGQKHQVTQHGRPPLLSAGTEPPDRSTVGNGIVILRRVQRFGGGIAALPSPSNAATDATLHALRHHPRHGHVAPCR